MNMSDKDALEFFRAPGMDDIVDSNGMRHGGKRC